MSLTREQALALLRTMKRDELAPRKEWYGTKGAAIEEEPEPDCPLCPTLVLAVAGGFNMDDFTTVLSEEAFSVGNVLERLHPYTGLTYDELAALVDQHDAHPRSRRRCAPEPEYLNAVLGVQP